MIKEYSKVCLITVLTMLFAIAVGHAQTVNSSMLKIERVSIDSQGLLNFWVKVTQDGQLYDRLQRDELEIVEIIADNQEVLPSYGILPKLLIEKQDIRIARHHVSFLIDNTPAITSEQLADAKRMIREVVDSQVGGSQTIFTLIAYDQNARPQPITFERSNVDQVLQSIPQVGWPADFYGALVPELRRLNAQLGKKTMLIFGAGHNDHHANRYQKQLPYDDADVNLLVQNLPVDMHILVVDQSAPDVEGSFASLQNDKTRYSRNQLPEDYLDIIKDNTVVKSNLLIKAYSKKPRFSGERREYRLTRTSTDDTDLASLQLGSATFPIDVGASLSWKLWLVYLISGLLVLIIIFSIGSWLVPSIREREFVKRYVSKYVKQRGVTHMDLYFNEPIEHGTLVVNKCKQVTPLSTWKSIGWQCPGYPECQHFNCNGGGSPDANEFSSMEGIFLKLNWVWFGAIGGFLGWLFLSIFSFGDSTWLDKVVEGIVGADFLERISNGNPSLVTQTISNNLLVGIMFSLGLLLMLSWMEERRASNRYSIWSSISRIAVRTLMGVILAVSVFLGGFYLQYILGAPPYISGLLSWLFFGLSVGIVISFRSSVSGFNGLIGGAIGALVGYQFYWLLSSYFLMDVLLANLVSMLLMGGIIGSILVSVVTSLEDYELEIIAPLGYQRTIPISKWLKSSIGVTIGKMPGSYVYVKWDDESVKPEHAELFVESDQVFVRPIDEVMVNQRIVSKPVALKHGDIISLGRTAVTEFRFVEK